jgi:hypothetical protein
MLKCRIVNVTMMSIDCMLVVAPYTLPLQDHIVKMNFNVKLMKKSMQSSYNGGKKLNICHLCYGRKNITTII